jgi:hypothetical protein
MSQQRVNEIVRRLEAVSNMVQSRFSHLTPEQLNKKSSPESWSIAQCLDHLIVTNKSYYPQFNALIEGKPVPNFWKSVPLLSGFFGNLLKKSVRPDEEKKFKTQPAFQPSQSDLPSDIVTKFLDSQTELKVMLYRLSRFDFEKVKITSPAANFITYSLDDLLEITALHEERHLKQAVRVAEQMEFTK